MMIDVYNIQQKKVGTTELPNRIFSVKWNPDLVHHALRVQLTNKRTNTAHAKDRSEVKGGGRKPWKQKGTGNARHGSIRSPIWKGGGVTHGPLKEKKYELKINKKMRQLAIFSALSRRLKDNEIKVVESLSIEKAKTQTLKKSLEGFYDLEKNKKFSVLLIPNESNRELYQASRNLNKVKTISPKSLNIYDLLNYKNILIDKGAIEVIDKHYHAIK